MSAPVHFVAGRELHVFVDGLLRRSDEAAQVAAPNVGLHHDAPLATFPRDNLRPGPNRQRGNLIQADPLAPGCLKDECSHRVQIRTIVLGQANRNRKALLPFHHFRDPLSAGTRFHHLLHIGNIEPISRQCDAVRGDPQFRDPGQDFGLNVGSARNGGQQATGLLPQTFQRRGILAEDLDRHIGFDSAHYFIQPHGHRLREVITDARNLFEAHRKLFHQGFPRSRRGPLFPRLQVDVHVGFVNAHGFGCQIGAAEFCYHTADLRELADGLLQCLTHLDGIGSRNARDLTGGDQQRTFIQAGHELGADPAQ